MKEFLEKLDIIIENQNYTNKLLESLIDNNDRNRFNSESMKKQAEQQLSTLQNIIMSSPAFKDNPERIKAMQNIFSAVNLEK